MTITIPTSKILSCPGYRYDLLESRGLDTSRRFDVYFEKDVHVFMGKRLSIIRQIKAFIRVLRKKP